TRCLEPRALGRKREREQGLASADPSYEDIDVGWHLAGRLERESHAPMSRRFELDPQPRGVEDSDVGSTDPVEHNGTTPTIAVRLEADFRPGRENRDSL